MHHRAATLAVPSRHVTHRKFKYVTALLTDVCRTWRKARLLQHLAQVRKEVAHA